MAGVCDHCGGPFTDGKTKRLFFTSNLRANTNSVLDSVKKLYRTQSGLIPESIIEKLRGCVLCHVCQINFRTAVVSFDSVVESLNKISSTANNLSFINKHKLHNVLIEAPAHPPVAQQPGSSTSTVPAVTPTRRRAFIPTRKTPIGRKIKYARLHPRSNKAYLGTIHKVVQKEVRSLLRTVMLDSEPSREEILPSFEIATKIVKENTPTLMAVLEGGCRQPSKQRENKITPPMMAILGIMLNCQNQMCNRFQKSIGVSLWKTKASEKTYEILQNFGLCTTYQTILNFLDKICLDYDKTLITWKEGIEAELVSYSTAPPIIEEMETSIPEQGSSKLLIPARTDQSEPLTEEDSCEMSTSDYEDLEPLDMPQSKTPTSSKSTSKRVASKSPVKLGNRLAKRKLIFEKEEPPQYYGYCFAFDNLNKLQLHRSYSSSNQQQMLNVISLVAIKNRIPIPNESAFKPSSQVKATDIPISKFLPSKEDFESIKFDHTYLIKQILVRGVKKFEPLRSKIKWHMTDGNSSLSASESQTVNLGILCKDENTTEGMIDIMTHIQSYLPRNKEGKNFKSVVWGDGLTADKLRSAQNVRLNSVTEDGKLDSLIPGVSHWHKRVILLNDDVDVLLKSNELTFGKGSLPFLRSFFGHRQASVDLKKKFNPTVQLTRFALHSYVCALALEIIEGERFLSMEATNMDPVALLDHVAKEIVEFEWHDIGIAFLQTRYCLCGSTYEETKDRVWRGCDNRECKKHVWYHEDCINNHISECELTAREPNFLPPPDSEDEDWYCCNSCGETKDDLVFKYTRALMFSFLNHECYRACIRENAGDKLVSYSKIHLIQFANKNHPNYLRICHRVLACLNGFAPPHIAHDLTWNSTVNVKGIAGKNLEIDLYNEFVNSYLKAHVMETHGRQSKESLERRSRAFGIATEIRNNILSFLEDDEIEKSHSKDYEKWRTDMPKCIDIIRANNVFKSLGKRSHEGFEEFNFNHIFIDNIVDYTAEITRLSTNLDVIQRCWDRVTQ